MFCNQCGKQIPDGAAVCPNCGAQLGNFQAPPQGQPMNNGYGMPQQQMQQQPMQQQSNPFAFMTKTYQGVPFPMKGLFSKANLSAKGCTMNFIGVIGAIIAFICTFLPMISAHDAGGIISMVSKLSRTYLGFKTGWILIVLSILIVVLYAIRFDFLAFLASMLNVLMFVHTWSVFGLFSRNAGGEAPLGFGFYLYLLATIACAIAPFVWSKIKKN